MQTFKKLLLILSPNELKRAGLLLIMILIMALLDMIGVASILPFITVLTNPDIIQTNSILNTIFNNTKAFGVETNEEFLFFLGILVFVVLVVSISFKALTTYAQLRFVQMRGYSIGKRLVEGYLRQPYSWFLGRNSAELGKNILSEADTVVGGFLKPLLDLIAKSLVTFSIIFLLIIVDPKLAVIIGFILGGAYVIIFYFIRTYLNQIGKKRLKHNEIRFKTVNEAFGATKEIKVGGLEKIYIKLFSGSAKIYAQTSASSTLISQLPRFFLEIIAFGGVLLIILYMMKQSDDFNTALPIVSLYVFAGYRLMPAIQQIYSSFVALTFAGPALDNLSKDIKNLKLINFQQTGGKLSFYKTISLKNIYFNYPNTTRTALKNISLTIPAKSSIGLVGATGSGKTTVVDIILGLLEAQQGTLKVDDEVITGQNTRSWQRSIGYVPQNIYLSDDTVRANIAFGVDPNDVIQSKVEQASKIASLHEFIVSELSNKYETMIGERGVRLSGGQRQRIGIARALYHDPKVLILDEATSALDNQTEKAVMDAVNNLNKDMTIILIAHRLSTVKNCNQIYFLKNGQLENQGTFDELIKINENFRANANT